MGIAAGKGGVGKSTLTFLLALALKKAGYTVGVLDADIYGPSIPFLLGVDTPPQNKSGFVAPAVGQGVSFFSFSFVKEGVAALRAPIANKVIEQCATEIAWGNLDFLLVDFPPGTGDIHLTALQTLDISGMLYVSTPQLIALLDVDKAYKMGKELDVPTLGFIENMGRFPDGSVGPFGVGEVKKYADAHGERFIGELPIEKGFGSINSEEASPLSKLSGTMNDALQSIAAKIPSAVEDVEAPFSLKLEWRKEYAATTT